MKALHLPEQFKVPLFARRYLKFCMVGGTGLLVDMAMLGLFHSICELNLVLSKFLAAEIAIMSNFLLNERWTFSDQEEKCPSGIWLLSRLAKFNVICAIGLCLSVALLSLQVFVFGMNVFVANFVTIVIVSIWNYRVNTSRVGPWRKQLSVVQIRA